VDAAQVKVLLIEDDPVDARLITDMLAHSDVASFAVKCVERLADGLEFLDQADEDVLLLDLNLPDSQGFETFARAYAKAPHMPIIPLTGLGDTAMGLRALREGAQDYLVKGEIDGSLLGRAIRYAVERKRTKDALRREHDFATTLLETAHALIVVLDTEGRVVQLNPFAERLTGWCEDEVRGQSWFDIFVTEDVGGDLRERYAEFLKAQEPAEHENPIVTREGRTRLVRWYNSPLRDASGAPTGMLAIGYDVTELREKEEQLRHAQKMEAVGRLAGGIAHDFNNQLTVVTGYSDLLLAAVPPDDPMRERIVEIHRAAMRAATLTNQLLAFSRRQVLNPQTINLNMIVGEMASPVARMIGEDVRLSIIPGADLGNVRADPLQVEQAVMNLIVNARDAMPHGGELAIETANAELDAAQVEGDLEAPPGSYVMLAVSDSGAGIPAHMVDKIFEPFFTTKPDGEGTGLGLSMVYGFVKQSGGHIQVETRPGKGTTFRLYLPRAEADVDMPVLGLPARPPQRGTGTILIVEDEEAVRQILVRVLRESGYTVLETANAREALPIGEHYDGPIDLLVTDVVMPETSGPEVAKRLAAIRPDMRVLYVTGYAETALLQHGLEVGRSALLIKPFTPSALAEAVHALLHTEHRTRA
jgi:two-component system cell cycle sensor histidine kinase/response regulator CckA